METMVYWNPESDKNNGFPFYWKDGYSVIPKGSRPIDENAKEFYERNKEKFNINLNNVLGDKITLTGIMQYGIDPEAVKASEITKLKIELAATDYRALKYAEGWYSDNEYEPYRQERQKIRDKINELDT